MADRAKAQNLAQETTSFFAGRPERGNHGLCPTIDGAEVDVHRARAAEGALPAAKSDAFHSLLRWIRGSGILASNAQKRSVKPSPPVSDRPTTSATSAFLGLLRPSTRLSASFTRATLHHGERRLVHMQQAAHWHEEALQHGPRPKEATAWLEPIPLAVEEHPP